MADLLARLDAVLLEAPRPERLHQRFSDSQLMEMAHAHAHMRRWYSDHQVVVKRLVGDDHPVFNLCLAATSGNTSVGPNVRKAIHAYHALMSHRPDPGKEGDEFIPAKGHPLSMARGGIHAIYQGLRKGLSVHEIAQTLTKGTPTKSDPKRGTKIQDYARALAGDPHAPGTIDMHMAGILFNKYPNSARGQKYPNLTPNMRAHGHRILKRVADKMGWHPTEVQAALWSAHFPMYRKWATADIKKYPTLPKKKKDGTVVQAKRRPPTDSATTYDHYLTKPDVSSRHRKAQEVNQGLIASIRAQHPPMLRGEYTAVEPTRSRLTPALVATEAAIPPEELDNQVNDEDEDQVDHGNGQMLLGAILADPEYSRPLRLHPQRQETGKPPTAQESAEILARLNQALGG